MNIELNQNTPAYLIRHRKPINLEAFLKKVKEIKIVEGSKNCDSKFPTWLLSFSGGIKLFSQQSSEVDLLSVLTDSSGIKVNNLNAIRRQIEGIRFVDKQGKGSDISSDQLTILQTAQIMSVPREDAFCGIENIWVHQNKQGELECVFGMVRDSGYDQIVSSFPDIWKLPGEFDQIKFSPEIFPILYKIDPYSHNLKDTGSFLTIKNKVLIC